MITVYLPQNRRFVIVEDFGCAPSISLTTLGLLIGGAPQVLAACICAVYSSSFLPSNSLEIPNLTVSSLALIICYLYKQHSQLSRLLENRSNLDRSKYLRVVVIAIASTVCLLPLGLYSFISQCMVTSAWPGLTKVHEFISEVDVIPASIWRSTQNSQYTVEIFRWEFVFSAFVIFACFGIHKEARMDYLSILRHIFHYVPGFRVHQCVVFLTIHVY